MKKLLGVLASVALLCMLATAVEAGTILRWGETQAAEHVASKMIERAAKKVSEATQGRVQRVVPFVKDTKNALVLRFEPPRSGPEMAGLQAAFKQAIQQHFQLEPRELSCGADQPFPDRVMADREQQSAQHAFRHVGDKIRIDQ